MDLGDVGGNVKDGCHIAAMGGVWMLYLYGFAGLRDYGGRLRFSPRVPAGFATPRFQLIVGDRLLEVTLEPPATTYHLRRGDVLVIWHEEKEVRLSSETPSVTRPNTFRWAMEPPPSEGTAA
jgi:alpha,alpha-trehalose phosphorylase